MGGQEQCTERRRQQLGFIGLAAKASPKSDRLSALRDNMIEGVNSDQSQSAGEEEGISFSKARGSRGTTPLFEATPEPEVIQVQENPTVSLLEQDHQLWPGCIFDAHCHLNLVLRWHFIVIPDTSR